MASGLACSPCRVTSTLSGLYLNFTTLVFFCPFQLGLMMTLSLSGRVSTTVPLKDSLFAAACLVVDS
jgi:hypothetical protein